MYAGGGVYAGGVYAGGVTVPLWIVSFMVFPVESVPVTRVTPFCVLMVSL